MIVNQAGEIVKRENPLGGEMEQVISYQQDGVEADNIESVLQCLPKLLDPTAKLARSGILLLGSFIIVEETAPEKVYSQELIFLLPLLVVTLNIAPEIVATSPSPQLIEFFERGCPVEIIEYGNRRIISQQVIYTEGGTLQKITVYPERAKAQLKFYE